MFEELASADNTPRSRHSKSNKSPFLLVSLFLCIIAAAGIAATIGYYNKESDSKEMEKAQTEFLLALNRQHSRSEEVLFWLDKEHNASFMTDLIAESDKGMATCKDMEREIKSRWGNDVKPLGKLNAKKSLRIDQLTDATNKMTTTILSGYHASLKLDRERLLAQLYADIPVKQIDIPEFDRTTVAGDQKYADFMRLLPSKTKLAKTERDAEVARRYEKEFSSVTRKWIKKSHAEIVAKIAELEDDFKRASND